MEEAVAGMPAPAAEAAQESLAGAVAVARDGSPAGERLIDAAQAAFVTGMHSAALVAAGIALAGAVVSLLWLPAREAGAAVETEAQAPMEAVAA